jgi:hypothetical protein
VIDDSKRTKGFGDEKTIIFLDGFRPLRLVAGWPKSTIINDEPLDILTRDEQRLPLIAAGYDNTNLRRQTF